eukprot:12414567-Karenia_brevis.AAC.1
MRRLCLITDQTIHGLDVIATGNPWEISGGLGLQETYRKRVIFTALSTVPGMDTGKCMSTPKLTEPLGM